MPPRAATSIPADRHSIWFFHDRIRKTPNPAAVEMLAALAHCRPAGAFFNIPVPAFDDWIASGRRSICRCIGLCPACWARWVVRVVGRLEEGPWRPGRRPGRQLFMARVDVPTTALALDFDALNADREKLFRGRLRLTSDYEEPGHEYYYSTNEEKFLGRVELNQSIEHTLTPHELAVAKQCAENLTIWCRKLGITGGLKVHKIGPRGRNFSHEIAVVGEVKFATQADRRRFEEATGVAGCTNANHTIAGRPIECVLLPANYKNAARILLAGTSWKFNMDEINAQLNRPARRSAWNDRRKCWVGLRGALAWPPLFLLSATSFWSRYLTIYRRQCRHNHAVTFGTWKELVPSDRAYKSPTQKRKQSKFKNSISGSGRVTVGRLNAQRKQMKISKAALARKIGCAPSTISRFFCEQHGSQNLRDKIAAVLFAAGAPVGKEIDS